MSASNEWTEYHLTPRGWERGGYQWDFGKAERPDPPTDRVMTCIYRERMSSGFSKMKESVETTWKGEPKAIAKWRDKHGSCPRILSFPRSDV